MTLVLTDEEMQVLRILCSFLFIRDAMMGEHDLADALVSFRQKIMAESTGAELEAARQRRIAIMDKMGWTEVTLP